MPQKVYSVRDMKVGSFGPLMFFRNDAEAIRSFFDATKRKDTVISDHAEDFSLFFVGSIDLETGAFSQSPDDIKPLATGLAIK